MRRRTRRGLGQGLGGGNRLGGHWLEHGQKLAGNGFGELPLSAANLVGKGEFEVEERERGKRGK